MKKIEIFKRDSMILMIYVAIFAIGLLILIYSINLGSNELSSIMSDNGGGMDTETYLIYLQQCISKYKYLGSILSILGGFGVLKNLDVKKTFE